MGGERPYHPCETQTKIGDVEKTIEWREPSLVAEETCASAPHKSCPDHRRRKKNTGGEKDHQSNFLGCISSAAGRITTLSATASQPTCPDPNEKRTIGQTPPPSAWPVRGLSAVCPRSIFGLSIFHVTPTRAGRDLSPDVPGVNDAVLPSEELDEAPTGDGTLAHDITAKARLPSERKDTQSRSEDSSWEEDRDTRHAAAKHALNAAAKKPRGDWKKGAPW